jgi:hypothetical protein
VIATRRQAGVRFALGALATVAGLGAATLAVVAPSTTATVWLLVAYGVSAAAVAARHMLLAVRVLHVRSRLGGRIGPLIPSRRRALAQLRRELDRLPETQHPTDGDAVSRG